MSIEWECFEHLREIVYVTDIETNQLVYMNAFAKEALNIKSDEEYQGRICYELLQGKDSLCEFCTNHKLQEGRFEEWSYTNPILERKYLLKDTLIRKNGRDYRMEIAINTNDNKETNVYFYSESDKIISNCMQQVVSYQFASESIDGMLKFTGETFHSDRAYIFEINKRGTLDNTHEWCAKGIEPQIDILQNVPHEAISWWFRSFEKGDVILLEDVEQIRETEPEAYAILKPQNIQSLIAGPIYEDGKIIGFIGVDNPDKRMHDPAVSLLNVMGYFISTLFKRRDLLKRLNLMSYWDKLTGTMNRHALFELFEKDKKYETLGVIFCDVSGLKKVNDTLGHEAGDEMLKTCAKTIRDSLNTERIFRVGGDEFVAVILDQSEPEFQHTVENLKHDIMKSQYHIAVGSDWTNEQEVRLEDKIKVADQHMYEDKKAFYNIISASREDEMVTVQDVKEKKSLFYAYLKSNYFDSESMFQSLTMTDASHYVYFGDLQTNTYYISDNMRDTFGYKSNIVQDLLVSWEDRIVMPEHKELYRKDIASMLQEKRTTHDLRYKVQDVSGNVKWIRCCGKLQWDEDNTKPLFFSGSVSTQDNTFVIDPITNFPREHSAQKLLASLEKPTKIITFCLNKFTEINNFIGRYQANVLLENIAKRLMFRFSNIGDFFRLEGIRFLLITKDGKNNVEYYIDEFRKIIEQEYQIMKVSVSNSCSFGVLEYPNQIDTPQALVENAMTLITCAKRQTSKPYIVYSPSNVEEFKQIASMEIVLGRNVADGMKNFRVVIQPVVSATTKKVIGGEVLLRWQFEGKDVSPGVFVPILERNGGVIEAGRWVFEQTVIHCRQLLKLNPDFYLTFNVSYHQITDESLIDFIESKLRQYQVDGSHIVIEFTETHFDEEPEKLKAFIQKCNKLNIRIALDDFGTAYSSLRLLLTYPVDIVKLDRSLLLEMSESDEKLDFICSIVYACHRFRKTVCMEGVETKCQSDMIVEAGCDMIQGYYYYKPMEAREVYKLIVET